MGLRLICCGQPKKIRVIEPNGWPRHFSGRFTLSDLLHRYPQYCIGDASGSILPADAELEAGSTYLILPLPRGFPGSSSSFLHKEKEEEEETAIGRGEASVLKPRNQMRVPRDSNPRRFSRIPAQEQEWDNEQSRWNETARGASSWQPSLDMISENDSLLQSKDEQPVKKMKKKTAKHGKYKFNHSSRIRVLSKRLQVFLASPALMFQQPW